MIACAEQTTTRAAHDPWQSAPTASACAEPLSFTLPPSLEAHEPPEARGLRRDKVRLMVSFLDNDEIAHTRFTHFPEFLQAKRRFDPAETFRSDWYRYYQSIGSDVAFA